VGLVRYFVFKAGLDWLVVQDGTPLARHETREAALRSAIVMADLMGAMKYDADVMVEADGRLGLAWSYGADPTPRIGEAA
jgi:hypothetical protein